MIIIKRAKKKILFENNEIITDIKKYLKEDETYKELCDDYALSYDFIDGVSISFEDIDVSAKTINAKIILNNQLRSTPDDRENWIILLRYCIHELTHAIQHMETEGEPDKESNKEYLDRNDELEAFQRQIKFDYEERGEEAIDYAEDLVEYHELDGKEADEKMKELLDLIEKSDD